MQVKRWDQRRSLAQFSFLLRSVVRAIPHRTQLCFINVETMSEEHDEVKALAHAEQTSDAPVLGHVPGSGPLDETSTPEEGHSAAKDATDDGEELKESDEIGAETVTVTDPMKRLIGETTLNHVVFYAHLHKHRKWGTFTESVSCHEAKKRKEFENQKTGEEEPPIKRLKGEGDPAPIVAPQSTVDFVVDDAKDHVASVGAVPLTHVRYYRALRGLPDDAHDRGTPLFCFKMEKLMFPSA